MPFNQKDRIPSPIRWSVRSRPIYIAYVCFLQIYEKKVFFLNSSPFDKKTFLFYKIEREERIGSVKWISENKVALGLKDGGIEIWQIDESMSTAKIIKRLEHDVGFVYPFTDVIAYYGLWFYSFFLY
jgi:WD40 repeat protein